LDIDFPPQQPRKPSLFSSWISFCHAAKSSISRAALQSFESQMCCPPLFAVRFALHLDRIAFSELAIPMVAPACPRLPRRTRVIPRRKTHLAHSSKPAFLALLRRRASRNNRPLLRSLQSGLTSAAHHYPKAPASKSRPFTPAPARSSVPIRIGLPPSHPHRRPHTDTATAPPTPSIPPLVLLPDRRLLFNGSG